MPARLLPIADEAAARPFAAMTYPYYAPDLLAASADGPVVAVGATDDDRRPCGLALAKVTGTDAALLSVLVQPDRRRAGLGTELVRAVEERVRERGAAELSGIYPLGKDATPAVERVLTKCGWGEAVPRMGLFTFGPVIPPGFLELSWVVESPLPEGFAVAPWGELTDAQRKGISEFVKADGLPAFADPFACPDEIDPRYSLVLTLAGRIVGWLIVHRVSPTAVRVAVLYADPRAVPPGLGRQVAGRFGRMWAADAAAGKPSVVTWIVEGDNPFLRVCAGRMLRGMPFTLTRTVRRRKRLGHTTSVFSTPSA
ncbi:MAG TPA: GNAT family N-acetyltransferase [Gemmataceae bacterium]|nr:GNAT family N-acetyltransferase [Gemmataceae bacterium]